MRSNTEVIKEAQANGKNVHFPTLVDLGHFQNQELHKKFQTYCGRVVLRGDSEKDDAGSFAVFTQQGASASQMSTAEILNTISRLPRCTGRAGDAVSACTQEKLEDAPQQLRLTKKQKSSGVDTVTMFEMPEKVGTTQKVQLFCPKDFFTAIRWQDYCGSDIWKSLLEEGWVFIAKVDSSDRFSCMTLRWPERNKIWHQCGRNYRNNSI